MLTVDGAAGEGGGQILRTALALSILTGTPFRAVNLRARREKPGLRRQHLAAVRAAATIAEAEVEGDVLGARTVTFRPRGVRAGDHTLAIGSAGSTSLLLQTVLWPLALADGPSRLVLEGGTHNPAAPPYPFLERSFAPLARRTGPVLDLTLDAWGFAPAGIGRVRAAIRPVPRLAPLEVTSRGPVLEARVTAAVAGVDEELGRRDVDRVARGFGLALQKRTVLRLDPEAGPGRAVWLEVRTEGVTAVFAEVADRVGDSLADGIAARARAWLAADVPIEEHLADQLLLPMALAGAGVLRTVRPTSHTLTNAAVIRQFLDVTVDLVEEGTNRWRVRVGRTS